jgi:hypothetical protein
MISKSRVTVAMAALILPVSYGKVVATGNLYLLKKKSRGVMSGK